MQHAFIAVLSVLLLSMLGGCAQPTNLTEGEIESRIASEYAFEDKYDLE